MSNASNLPTDLKYTASHEWIREESDGSCTIGITDLAQEALGELVYVELPDTGATLSRGDACAVVESTKAASDVYSPLDGEVVATNESLADAPQAVNEAAFTEGWLFRIKPSDDSQKADLLDAAQYLSGQDE